MTTFTQAEHDFLTGAFSKLTVNLADPNAPDTTKLARGILDKVKELQEKNESTKPEDGVAEPSDSNVKLNGDGKTKAKRPLRKTISK